MCGLDLYLFENVVQLLFRPSLFLVGFSFYLGLGGELCVGVEEGFGLASGINTCA